MAWNMPDSEYNVIPDEPANEPTNRTYPRCNAHKRFASPEVVCTKPKGHTGRHADAYTGAKWGRA